ncbi:nitroreductase family protein [Ammoniphilus sp. CFH 90114]|uniref:nitroreductase family protein n=1 Tax=Ammoniphilus sp. CFH 90114 TaxID=2493665 RepID=UPI00100FEC57|nr:nitroreductase family protein [Ammoniphilus sp. CFH 90114]RXT03621.1 nitroreductase family protein [Ammoniphilus sp. CFH 90114]
MSISAAEREIHKVMKERSSVRKYKRGEKIPPEILKDIIELAGSAPSSWNLQHWKFLIIEDQDIKDKLLPIAYGQQQVSDCSALIIVLGDIQANENADRIYEDAVKVGYMTNEARQKLVENINGAYHNVHNFGLFEAIRNASLAAMQLMLAAKSYGLDSVPMGGFNADALRQELRIPDRYTINMMIPIGYAEAPAHQTPRFPVEEIMIRSFT